VANQIGDYSHRFDVLRRSTLKEPTYGEAESGWSAVGFAWGKVEETGARQDDTGNRSRSVADAIITLRGRLDVSGKDRLRKVATGEIYRIDGVRKSDVETICEGFRVTEPKTEPET
jgi:head-tail adaptor